MGIRERTETKILDAAEELFFARGIAATPVDAILETARVSPATLYRGFASKDALLAAALRRRHATWIAEWDAAIGAAASPEDALLSVFDALDAFRSRPEGARWCAFLGTAAEYADPPAEIAAVLDLETATYRERLTSLADAAGLHEPAEVAARLLLIVSGYLAMRLRSPELTARDARGIARTVVAEARRRD